jgi:hypothetical protein
MEGSYFSGSDDDAFGAAHCICIVGVCDDQLGPYDVILDNQSEVNVFKNKKLLTGWHTPEQNLNLSGIVGKDKVLICDQAARVRFSTTSSPTTTVTLVSTCLARPSSRVRATKCRS